MKAAATVLVALAWLTGCAGEAPASECSPDGEEVERPAQICDGHFTYEPGDWTAAELVALQSVAASWNEFVGGELVKLEAGRGDSCHIAAGKPEETTQLAVYVYDGPHAAIVVDRERIAEKGLELFRFAVAHEIGHSLGFVHGAGGIMCGSANSSSRATFTADDRAQCEVVGWCS